MKSLATLLISGAGLFAMVNSSPWVMVQKDQLAQLQALAKQNVDNAFTDGATASAPAESSALVDPSTTKAPAIQLAATSAQPAGTPAWMWADSSNPLNQPANNASYSSSEGTSSPVIYYNDYSDYYHHYWGHRWHLEHEHYSRPNTAVMIYKQRQNGTNH